jgi:hypothetical protein
LIVKVVMGVPGSNGAVHLTAALWSPAVAATLAGVSKNRTAKFWVFQAGVDPVEELNWFVPHTTLVWTGSGLAAE